MTVALWCVLVAALMPMVFTALAKTGKGFDNHHPREYLANLSGWRKRSNAVQMNSFEAFPPFAAGVIIAQMLHATQMRIDTYAIAFIVLRLLFGICYIADWATLRSIVWFGGIACVVGLFVLAA